MKSAVDLELIQRIIDLRSSGKTQQEIADEVGQSRPTVAKYLKAHMLEVEVQTAAKRLTLFKSKGYSEVNRTEELLARRERLFAESQQREVKDLPTAQIFSELSKVDKELEKLVFEDQRVLFGKAVSGYDQNSESENESVQGAKATNQPIERQRPGFKKVNLQARK